jgi:hypothetical protein
MIKLLQLFFMNWRNLVNEKHHRQADAGIQDLFYHLEMFREHKWPLHVPISFL